MRKYLFLLVSLFSLSNLSAQVTWGEPRAVALGGDEYRVELTARLDEGWHMYDLVQREGGANATTFSFSESKDYQRRGGVRTAEPAIVKYDEIFAMDIGYYKDSVTFAQDIRLQRGGAMVEFVVEWMLCNDTSCLPPTEQEFSIAVGEFGAAGSTGSMGATGSTGSAGTAGSLWLIIVEAMLWGFAALLTPCVFPMVPMTISFFMKGEGGESRGRLAAALYGLFIVLLYTLPIAAIILITRVLGGDTVTADIFNWIATHWLPNLLFFVVFIIFALSFFGLFEITLPSSWVNRSDSRAGRGSLGGIFFLALTLVLVSFSCTGPIVGSVLIKSAAGEFWQPIITMLSFSVAFALPFVAVALSPALVSRLPKSGGWLGSVKVVLGFLELALALKFLSVADQIYHWGLLSRNLYLVLWIVIFSLLGLYLLGLLRIGHTAFKGRIGLPRLAVSVAIFGFVAYLATGLWGAALKPLAGYLPPLKSHEFVIDNDLEAARKYAARANKPILLDFTGYGCVNCREMEQRVWSDPRVERILREEYVVVALYMDDKEQLPESEWVTTESGRVLKSRGRAISNFAKERYGVNSQPTYIPIGNDGEPLTAAMGYNLDIDGYIQFLESGVAQYRKKY